ERHESDEPDSWVRAPKPLEPRLVVIVVWIALLRRPTEFVERAVGAPRLGIEARRACHRQDVAMAAALRSVFGRTAPAARLEARHCRGHGRGLGRGLSRSGWQIRRRWRSEWFSHQQDISLYVNADFLF